MTTHFPCLGDTQLADMLAGRVSTSEWARIDFHIDKCPSCRDLVAAAALAGSDGPGLHEEVDEPSRPVFRLVNNETYVFGEEIGSGGMGSVVSGWDTRLMRPIAIKTLTTNASQDVHRFEREAVVGARLQHPGIVPVYDAAELPTGQRLIAMKLVRGRSLSEVVLATEQVSDRLALLTNILAVADAIAYAHSQGVVHRDLKPSNVMLGNHGETIVVDWGLALLTGTPPEMGKGSSSLLAQGSSDQTKNGKETVVGTPSFMAAEQARGDTVDERADVYGLGALLYFALAKTPPNAGSTSTEILRSASSGEVESLNKVMPGLPNDLVTLVERAMEPSREDRYRSAIDFAADLRRFLAGKLVSAHPYTRLDRVARWAQRNRSWVIAGSLALILAISGGFYSLRRIVTEKREAERAKAIAENQRAQADQQRNAAEALVQSMMSDLRKRLKDLGRSELLQELGQLVEDYYESTSAIPTTADRLHRSVAAQLLGDVLSDRGEFGAALIQYQVATGFAKDASLARRATLHARVAHVHQRKGEYEDAAATYETALALFGQGDSPKPRVSDQSHALAVVHAGLAEMHDATGELNETARHYEIAQQIWHQLLADAKTGDKRTRMGWQRSANQATAGIADAYIDKGMHKEAIALLEPAVTATNALISEDASNPALRREHASIYLSLGNAETMLSHPQLALKAYESALKSAKELLLLDPSNVQNYLLVSVAHETVGNVVVTQGQGKAALAAYGAARKAAVAGLRRSPGHAALRHKEFLMWLQAGRAEYLLGNFDRAHSSFSSGIQRGESILEATPDAMGVRDDMAFGYGLLGTVQMQLGHIEDAATSFEAVIKQSEQLLVEEPEKASFRQTLFSGYGALITLELNRHEFSVAEKTADLFLKRAVVYAKKNPDNVQDQLSCAHAYTTHGEVQLELKRAEQALVSFRESLRIHVGLYEHSPTDTLLLSDLAFAHYNLGRALRRNRNPQAAGRERKRAGKLLEQLEAIGPLSPSELEMKALLATEDH